ncbi:hypothetical protein [uncultured Devosia sp.]|uniref:hypothetical protein n=1 Tax=uncultured Devosia sp. TaxID=211434 RepID=UPI002607B7D5|nr:hypothetical protein [uncultured Devosia sp.]
MSDGRPIEAVWTGEVFKPVDSYWQRRADKQFARGEILRLVHMAETSHASYGHYFATLKEAWQNMPTLLSERFPSVDHLRAYALIKTGWHNSHTIPCGSPSAARKMVAYIRPIDEFAVVTAHGSVVHVFTAKSQSRQHMNIKDFRESKNAVLEFVANLIRVTKEELTANTGRAA